MCSRPQPPRMLMSSRNQPIVNSSKVNTQSPQQWHSPQVPRQIVNPKISHALIYPFPAQLSRTLLQAPSAKAADSPMSADHARLKCRGQIGRRVTDVDGSLISLPLCKFGQCWGGLDMATDEGHRVGEWKVSGSGSGAAKWRERESRPGRGGHGSIRAVRPLPPPILHRKPNQSATSPINSLPSPIPPPSSRFRHVDNSALYHVRGDVAWMFDSLRALF